MGPLLIALLSRCCQNYAVATLMVRTTPVRTQSWVIWLFLVQRKLANACRTRM